MTASITASVATPGQATVTVAGLTPASRTFQQRPLGDGSDPLGTGFPGWSAGASTVATDYSDELRVEVSAATGYIHRTMSTAVGTARLLRVRVQLVDPEAIPVRVWGTDQTGVADPENPARYVGADPVDIDVYLDGDTATSARFYVERPAGVTGTVSVSVTLVEFWRVGDTPWYVERTDHNGTAQLADWRTSQLYPSAGGTVQLVDREAALGEAVTWTVREGWSAVVADTDTQTLTDSDGYAMLHRPLDAASPMLAVALVDMTSGRRARATVLDVEDDPYPVIPVRPLSARSGSFSFYCATLDDAETLADELALGEQVLVRQPHPNQRRIDTYFVVESVDVGKAELEGFDGMWKVAGSFHETRRGVA